MSKRLAPLLAGFSSAIKAVNWKREANDELEGDPNAQNAWVSEFKLDSFAEYIINCAAYWKVKEGVEKIKGIGAITLLSLEI
jgi:hypothetical protein